MKTPHVTVKHLSVKKIKEITIPLPPLPIQKKIADILDQAQQLREWRREADKLTDEYLKSVFLDMFGDPVKNEKGWEMRRLGELVENHDKQRIPLKKEDRTKMQGKYPYYGATGIIDDINDYIFNGTHLLIAEDGKNLLFRKKPIAFLARGKFWVNNHAHVVAYNGMTELTYLEYFLNIIDIAPFVTGIDQYKLNRGNLDRIRVFNPPLPLQKQFATIVEKVEQMKSQQTRSKKHINDLFNSLMQRAFSGELMS